MLPDKLIDKIITNTPLTDAEIKQVEMEKFSGMSLTEAKKQASNLDDEVAYYLAIECLSLLIGEDLLPDTYRDHPLVAGLSVYATDDKSIKAMLKAVVTKSPQFKLRNSSPSDNEDTLPAF